MLEIHSLQAFKSLASAYSTTAACIKFKKELRTSLVQSFLLEAPPRFELGVKVLQTRALPLGYGAISALGKIK